jgi:chemotaxis protein CheX
MTLTQDQLVEVVDDVLATFVGSLVEEPQPSDVVLPVTAFVQVTGTWTGTVLVSCSEQLAHTTAAAMFDQPSGALAHEDVSDALGEVANMVGGSIKALMPEPSGLSLPTVIFGASEASVPGAELLHRLDRTCGGEPLRVTVLTANVAPADAGTGVSGT